jgi:hypothetical protein
VMTGAAHARSAGSSTFNQPLTNYAVSPTDTEASKSIKWEPDHIDA